MSNTPKTDALREVIVGQYKEDELTGNGMGNLLAALTDIETLERELGCSCKHDVEWKIRRADNGESWNFTHTHIGSGDTIIAQVQHQTKDSGWPHVHDVEEMWANARLIAAAPEILDALKGLLEVVEENYDNRHEVEAALHAISKAEGRDA